jgi:hypothetical protein
LKKIVTLHFAALTSNTFGVNKTSIERDAKASLEFQYGHVTYQKFSDQYRDRCLFMVEGKEDLFDRRIKALPCAVWALAQLIYHIAKTIFCGIPLIFQGREKYLQTYVFYVVRDFQEIFGHIISLFYNQYGLYHIQESQLQKTCYDCFLANYSHAYDQSSHPQEKNKSADIFSPSLLHVDFDLKKPSLPKSAEKIFSKKDLAPKDKKESADIFSSSLLHVDDDSKEGALVKSAEEFFSKGDLVNAFKMIDKICYETRTKELFLAKLAEEYLSKGDLVNAFKMIDKICYETHVKELFLAKLAEVYFGKGDLVNAFKMIDKICYETHVKELFLAKLAEVYFSKGDLVNAFKMIDKICYETHAKDVFLAKLAEEYLSKGDLVNALKMIHKIYQETKIREEFLTKLIENYYKLADKENVLRIIQAILVETIVREIVQTKTKLNDLKKVMLNLDDIASKLAPQCYDQIDRELKQDKKEKVLSIIQSVFAQHKESFFS